MRRRHLVEGIDKGSGQWLEADVSIDRTNDG